MTPVLLDRAPTVIEIDGEQVQVRVRESTRASTARILIGADRPLEIIVPAGTDDARVDELLVARQAWIAAKRKRVAEVRDRPARLGLDRPGVVWLAGQAVAIDWRDGRVAVARLAEGRLVVSAPTEEHRARAIERWYRRQATTQLRVVAGRESARLDLRYRSLAVRDQHTRWGSCSAGANLSVNWRLILAPPEVLEYVVIHELCHLRIANHSKSFWRLLEAALPGWQRPASWIAEHGGELRAYRPSAGTPAGRGQ
jgi:predicted metal-dependent hydrolase